ncbi:PKD domain-containing protein [Mucilaginibacter sp. Bleaf8]|uniref:PKD-like domain-containing protein n=1 Tax=Mucilaginibacter sp. Bleaf8 TaxID=2834430 RepID=UPI001BCC4497|nr:PKD-like domain-containing protein [Mucilaginibacter sp. Bleaf8]MBS7565235.1 PKD domain-containing protein [Mucilaginibacter sp. Bleaf8]
MDRAFTRFFSKIFTLLLFLVCASAAYAQTIGIRHVDPGPYGQGSSISAEIAVDDNSGCISINNTYNLYLSDANGNFTSTTPIGSFDGFFTGFVNGIIPANTPAGTGYRLRVQSTNPAKTSDPSQPFTINATPGITAALTSSSTLATSNEVFGSCQGASGSYTFTSPNGNNNTVTANFYNENAQQQEITNQTIMPSYRFGTPKAATYTITVKTATSDNIIGTKSYLLINNQSISGLNSVDPGPKCLGSGGADVSVSTKYRTPDGGIELNYPGTVYNVDWGDGRTDKYTFCQLKATGGRFKHNFINSSCGARDPQGNVTNQFSIRLSLINRWCPTPAGSTPPYFSSTQAVFLPPTNNINGPDRGCVNTDIIFNNASDPGESSNSVGDCKFSDARYSWYVDNDPNPKATNYTATQPFKWKFTTPGQHTVRLQMENNQTSCPPNDAIFPICIENPSKADFTIPATYCITQGSLIPVDKSDVYRGCNTATFKYVWKVTPSAGVSFANNTTANSVQPQFVFANPGKYQVDLTIDGPACGPAVAAPKTIIVNGAPTATLSADFSMCGKDHTLTFNNANGSQTKTTLIGTVEPDGNTYLWSVRPLDGQAAATFANNTSASSQYPQINFPAFGRYEVSVKHSNACGTAATDKQIITFLEAATVNAGADQTVCPSDVIALTGTISQTYPVRWTGGAGTFSNPTSLTTTYTPTAAERTSGQVLLKLTATTNLPGDCANISDEVIITINPANPVTSAASKAICTGTAVEYTPTSTVAGSTFTWTATGSAGAGGFSATGTGTIDDVLTNSSGTANATVTYVITPRANNCAGTPFTLTVTVKPKPQITPTGPANNTICSGSPAGITLQTNVAGTQFTWTVATTGTVNGATAQNTPVTATAINQVLTNTGTAAATVTYTIIPVSSGTAEECAGQPKQITITVQPATPQATAGADKTLCNQSTYQLEGNNPAPFTGVWTSNQPGVTFSNPNQYNATVSGLQPGKTYIFTWTINGQSPCGIKSDQVTIINNAPVTNFDIVAPVPTLTCSGNTISIVGKAALGGDNNPKYQWESSVDGGANWAAIGSQTGRDLQNFQVFDNIRFRRVVTAGACSETSNVVSITVQPPLTNNTITVANTKICTGTVAQLTGSVPQGADGNASNYTYQWQTRANGSATWQNIPGATSQNYTTPALTAGAQYRRLVGSTYCQMSESAPVTLTIVQNPIAKILFNTDVDCVPFDIQASNNIRAEQHPDRNLEYRWYIDGNLVGTGVNFPVSYAITAPGQSVTVRLVTTSLNQCQPDGVDEKTFRANDQFTLDFTANYPIVNNTITVCGSTAITFTNKSTPIGSATYLWNFGGASPGTSTVAQPGAITFAANAPGAGDRVYTVTLNGTPNCGVAVPKTIRVVVTSGSPLPVLEVTPASQCGVLNAQVFNRTSGTNQDYQVYVEDANTGQRVLTLPVVTDTRIQNIMLDREGDFNVFLKVTSLCGTPVTSAGYPVKVLPNNLNSVLAVASGQQTQDCVPFTVTFENRSANATTYWYDWGDGSRSQVYTTNGGSIPNIEHEYKTAGTYFPVLHTGNDCRPDLPSTNVIKIVGIGRPEPDFASSNTESPSCYTCTLVRFTNNTPDPDNNITYTWDFGDGSTSNDKSPSHTYDFNKGSSYVVKLTAVNVNGCDAYIRHNVTIIEPSTALFLPNAFMPTGNNLELRTFIAKGSGMSAWHMRIFNNYGQLIWETDKLDSRGAPTEGWDGSFRGTPAPQGVYIWQIDATFFNGQQWKGMSYNNSTPSRTGAIHLIR